MLNHEPVVRSLGASAAPSCARLRYAGSADAQLRSGFSRPRLIAARKLVSQGRGPEAGRAAISTASLRLR